MSYLKNHLPFFTRIAIPLCVLLLVGFAFSPNQISGQETASSTDGQAVDQAAYAQARQEFDTSIAEWKQAIKDIRTAGNKFLLSERADAQRWRDKWKEAIAIGERKMSTVIPASIKLYKLGGKKDPDLNKLIARIFQTLFEEGKYQKAYDLGQVIVNRNPGNAQAKFLLGRCAMLLNKFEEADAIGEEFSSLIPAINDKEQVLFGQIGTLKTLWKEELDAQKKDALAKLPRVQMKTTKGTIVLELFEDQAPDTVGNFISLVEAKYYDGKTFHRVINHFMAQAGAYTEAQEYKPVGYFIYDEFNRPDARSHFRGSLSMAKGVEPNTGNSQFFINFVPTPGLNGLHTVFGRVISGWDALDQLNRNRKTDSEGTEDAIEGALDDKIISVRVIRKRDHEYKPNIVKN